MDTSVVVSVIAAASGLTVAAISYLFTKWREREADWRKWKYEQYKEFLVTMSGCVGINPTPDGRKEFSKACNALHLIGSKGVLLELHTLLDAIGNPSLSKSVHDALLSKLIWEIRHDVRIPGTPDASEFTAQLWSPGSNLTER
jgi:hypothetical protein